MHHLVKLNDTFAKTRPLSRTYIFQTEDFVLQYDVITRAQNSNEWK